MATMSVQIVEEVTLNGRNFGQTRTTSITGVNAIDTRVFVATSTEMDLILFDTADGAGQFTDGDIKYLRITHLGSADNLEVRVVGTDEEYAAQVPSGGSFIIFNQLLDATQTSTTPAVTADGTVALAFANINKISIASDNADITTEYFVATS